MKLGQIFVFSCRKQVCFVYTLFPVLWVWIRVKPAVWIPNRCFRNRTKIEFLLVRFPFRGFRTELEPKPAVSNRCRVKSLQLHIMWVCKYVVCIQCGIPNTPSYFSQILITLTYISGLICSIHLNIKYVYYEENIFLLTILPFRKENLYVVFSENVLTAT